MTLYEVNKIAQLTRRSDALEKVIEIVAEYLPPDSDISSNEALSRIIAAIETNAGHQFVTIKGEASK